MRRPTTMIPESGSCAVCGEPASLFIEYSQKWVCGKHSGAFLDLYTRRVLASFPGSAAPAPVATIPAGVYTFARIGRHHLAVHRDGAPFGDIVLRGLTWVLEHDDRELARASNISRIHDQLLAAALAPSTA